VAPAEINLLDATAAAEHFAAIVESSDDAIISKDSEGIITSWNPAAERMYGWSAQEAIGRSIAILIPSHRAGEERRILDQILVGDHVDHYETDRVTKDGREIKVSLSVSPIKGASGQIEAASVIARDITRRQHTLDLAMRLQEVTAALAREATQERINEVVLNQMVRALGAQAAAVGIVEDGQIVISGSTGYSENGLAAWERFPVEADVPMGRSVRTGESIWTTSPEELTERFPGLGDSQVRFAALAVLPLAAGDEPFGAISLSFDRPREFDAEERAFLLSATQQAAYALGRARMFEEERLQAERQRFLAEAGDLLTRSLDPEATLEQLARLAVRHIADWCGIELVDEMGELKNVAVAHADKEKVAEARELRERYPVDPSLDSGVPNVIRTGSFRSGLASGSWARLPSLRRPLIAATALLTSNWRKTLHAVPRWPSTTRCSTAGSTRRQSFCSAPSCRTRFPLTDLRSTSM
jgi:PAS domain S-box-containing protein